jgi:bacterioferritin (cytochrome b1)
MTLKEIEEKLVTTLKKWQKIEEEAIISTGEVIAEMKNPLPRAIFEIIQRDAENHRRVLELIVQSHEKEGFKLTVDQLEEVSKVVSRHVQVEKRMIESAKEVLQLISGKNLVLHEYFLKYLQEDEKKHMDLLKGLENIKKHIHPYGPSA